MGASVSSEAQVPISRSNSVRPSFNLPVQRSTSSSSYGPSTLTSYDLPRAQVSTSVSTATYQNGVQARSQSHSSTSNPFGAPSTGAATRSQPTTTTHLSATPSTTPTIPVRVARLSTSQRLLSSPTPANEEITQCPFKKGDKVKLIAISEDGLKTLVNSDGGWDPKAIKYLNKTGIVNGIGDNREVTFDFNDSQVRWTFNSRPTDGFLIDDVVKLTESESELKKLQRGHGEFVPDMTNFLGRKGIVFKVFTDGDLRVTFDGGSWTLNPQSVRNLSRSDYDPIPRRRPENKLKLLKQVAFSGAVTSKVTDQSPFAINDRVKLISIKFSRLKELQKGHGGWNPRLVQCINKTGIVIGITRNQDIRVLFDYSRLCWTLNPEVLKRNYAGDLVKVIKNVYKFKQISSEPKGETSNIRGETGVVVDTNNEGVLLVKFGVYTWTLGASHVMNLSELERLENRKKMEKDKDDNHESISWKDWINQLIAENSQLNPYLTSKMHRSQKTDEDSNIHYLIEKNRSLQEQLTKLEESSSCGICLETPKNVIFICGHGACTSCANNLLVCHMCRRSVTHRIPIF